MTRHLVTPIVTLGLLTACDGAQSALHPAGLESARIATLFWVMSGGALIVWFAMIALALYAGRPREPAPNHRRDRLLVIAGGVVVPTFVLTALLVYGLMLLPSLVARAPAGSLLVDVEGEMWWWRVRYQQPGQGPVELANEIRLPVGEPVQFRLSSDNVIHSFWVPALGGKMDMIPGRVTYLALTPARTGVFTGVCAEYCGQAHAFMRFSVEVMERPAFDRWLAHQAAPAAGGPDGARPDGLGLFLSSGCGACHTVRGTPADGTTGPDLTHVGSRRGLAAAAMPTDEASFRRWVASPGRAKPGAHMPPFGMLPPDELSALATYLEDLQ